MLLYRIAHKKYATDASGEGARRKGGQWNPRGVSIHYTSSTAGLAILEVLVHVDPDDLPPVQLVTYELPNALVEDFKGKLPRDWFKVPSPPQLASAGEKWVNSGSSLALRVPATLFPNGPDMNVLINPNHPDINKLKTISIVDFGFDPRL